MSSAQAPSHAGNSFDAIRLGLALVVIYSHSYAVGGFGDERTFHAVKAQTTGGSAAVLGFFGISGYLVTKSFYNRPEWWGFIKRRLFRILPGYYFSLLIVSFLLAPLIFAFKGDPESRWHLSEALDFIWQNGWLEIHRWSIGTAVRGLPFDGAINGSLWSLFPEVSCYTVVLVLGILGLLRKGIELPALTGFLFVLNTVLVLNPATIAPVIPSLIFYTPHLPFYLSFFVGAASYLWASTLGFSRLGAIFWILCCAFLLRNGGWSIFGPVIFPLALMHCAHSFSLRLPVDLSYGLYLFHFPCFQLAAALHLNRQGYWPFLAVSAAMTLILAVASWFLVEKPFLRLKRSALPPAATLTPA